MCTLSWIPCLDGYVLVFSRDERRTRPKALPPSVRVIDGVSFLAPTDPEGGGTWVSSNSAGVTIALANRYHDTFAAEPARRESRGRLVLGLASALSVGEVEDRMNVTPLDRYDGFTLMALEPGMPARLFGWDGRALTASSRADAGLLIASSAKSEAAAIAARAEALHSLARAEGWTRRTLLQAHAGHVPSAGTLSICMHRSDASTVSLTHIEVDAARVAMAYHDGQPCGAPPVTRASLARTGVAIGG